MSVRGHGGIPTLPDLGPLNATKRKSQRPPWVNHGRVVTREGDVMTIEVPADVASGPGAMWGESGINPAFTGCDTRQAERRVFDHDGKTVVCPGDMVTTTFNRYRIYLAGKPPEVACVPTPEGSPDRHATEEL